MGESKRDPTAAMILRARRHFQSIAILGAFDRAEARPTSAQFAAAARVAARTLSTLRARCSMPDRAA